MFKAIPDPKIVTNFDYCLSLGYSSIYYLAIPEEQNSSNQSATTWFTRKNVS